MSAAAVSGTRSDAVDVDAASTASVSAPRPAVRILTPRGIKLEIGTAGISKYELIGFLSRHPLTCFYTSYELADNFEMKFVPYTLLGLKEHLQRLSDIVNLRHQLDAGVDSNKRGPAQVLDIVVRECRSDLYRKCLSAVYSDLSRSPNFLAGELHFLKVVLPSSQQEIEVTCSRHGFTQPNSKRVFETLYDLLCAASDAFAKTMKLVIADLVHMMPSQTAQDPAKPEPEHLKFNLALGADAAESRDWNGFFQEVYDLEEDSLLRDHQLNALYNEFVDAARHGAKLIVEGNLGPANPEELPENQIFIHNNIFFLRALPHEDVSQGAIDVVRKTYKNANYELMSFRMMLEARLPKLHVTPMCFVDYFGHRIVAYAVVGGVLNDRKQDFIVHGDVETPDGVVRRSHEEFAAAMLEYFRARTGISELDKEIKAVMGSDRRLYAMDLVPLTPVDDATESSTGAANSGGCYRRPERKQQQQQQSIDELVSELVQEFKTLYLLLLTGEELVRMMHEKGINVRYLGRLMKECESHGENNYLSFVKSIAEREAVARACKGLIRSRLRRSSPLLTVSPMTEFLNDFVTAKDGSAPLLQEVMQMLRQKFSIAGMSVDRLKELAADMQLWKRLFGFLGVTIRSRTYVLSKKRPFAADDFLQMEPVVHCSFPLTRQGQVLLSQFNEYLSSMEKFQDAILTAESALHVISSVHGLVHREVANCYEFMTNVILLTGDKARAVILMTNVFEIARKVYGWEHPFAFRALEELGNLAFTSGYKQQALVIFEHALQIATQSGRLVSVHTALLQSIALARKDLGDSEGAMGALRHCLGLQEQLYGDKSEPVAGTCRLMSDVSAGTGRYREAAGFDRRARDIVSQLHGVEDARVVELNSRLRQMTELAVKAARQQQQQQQQQ